MTKFIKMSISVLLIASLVMGISFVSKVAEKKVGAATYKLLWSEDFNGNSLDMNNWNIEVNGDGGGNNEKQYYTDSSKNIEVSNGTLKIHALRESYNGKSYTSGRINTMNKQSFQYGKIEARIKLPRFTGSWPAFWMLGSNYEKVGWPRCGEIDIMEAINDNNNIYANLHWQNKSMQGDTSGLAYDIGDRTAWHVYGFEWTENYMKFYIDGKYFQSYRITNEKDMEEFTRAHFIILNLAIGGRWPGYSIDNTAFPDKSTMEVDYVRAYERTDRPTPYVGPVQTITHDAVAEYKGNWVGSFNTDKLGEAGTVTALGKPNNGFVADVPNIGSPDKDSAFFASALLKNVKVYNSSIYTFKATITSDKDKRIMIRVIDGDRLEYLTEYINLEAHVPYEFSTNVQILSDFASTIDIAFGFAKINGEPADNYSSINVRVENISFKTTTIIPVPTKATTKATTKKTANVTVKKTKIKKVVRKKKSLKLTLKKIKGAKGYLVRYSDNKKFDGYWDKKTTKPTITLKKLDRKTKYYIKVKAYKKSGKGYVYGKFSKYKVVKTK